MAPMPLATLRESTGCESQLGTAWELMHELYPICRSITGDGVRASLGAIGRRIPLSLFEVPSGTHVFDWEVPPEWNIRGAWIKDNTGRTLVDFRSHTLHVMSYSVPVRAHYTLAELKPHLHTLPEHPDW